MAGFNFPGQHSTELNHKNYLNINHSNHISYNRRHGNDACAPLPILVSNRLIEVSSHFGEVARYINLNELLGRHNDLCTIFYCKAFGLVYLTPLLLISRDVAGAPIHYSALCVNRTFISTWVQQSSKLEKNLLLPAFFSWNLITLSVILFWFSRLPVGLKLPSNPQRKETSDIGIDT